MAATAAAHPVKRHLVMDAEADYCDVLAGVECHQLTPVDYSDSALRTSGSSRRKKSRPSRAYVDLEVEAPAAPPAGLVAPAPGFTETPTTPEMCLVLDNKSEVVLVKPEASVCCLCGLQCETAVLLALHMQVMHSEAFPPTPDPATDYPTKYHRLGSELQQSAMPPIVVAPIDDLPPATRPNGGLGALNGDWDAAGAKSRIFHPDAYCEICDREFCNKYFLKTHKANKHGIFEGTQPEISSIYTELATPVSIAPLPPPVPVLPAPLLPAPLLPAPILPTLEKQLPAPVLTSATADIPSTSASTPVSTTKSDSMDDYCEICQKHFCNKYYLRKHKSDVHGLVVEGSPLPSSTKKARVTSSFLPIASAAVSTPQLPLMMPSVTVAAGINGGALTTTMANIMFINPFASPLALLQAQPLLQAPFAHQPIVPLPLPTLLPPALAENKAPEIAANPTEKAYCELCCKEFCDKFFLRIHKANKHGVFTEEERLVSTPRSTSDAMTLPVAKPEAEKLPEAAATETKDMSNFSLAQCMAMLPPSPLLRPPLLDGVDSDAAPGMMFSTMMAAKLADRVICDLCGKEVCNKYFLKTHKLKVHGVIVSLPDEPEPEWKEMAEKPPEERPGDSDLLKMGIDPEAYCDICKKEFCSKYFLKTHRANIHGMKSVSMMPAALPSISLPTTPIPIVPRPPHLPMVDGLHKWKWKEPVTPARVRCSICRKEVANMQTHVLNKHSLVYDPQTGVISSPTPQKWLEMQQQQAAARTSCYICKQDVSDMKAHMLEQHGLSYDTQTGDISKPTADKLLELQHIPQQLKPQQLIASQLVPVPQQVLAPAVVLPQPLQLVKEEPKSPRPTEPQPAVGEAVPGSASPGAMTPETTVNARMWPVPTVAVAMDAPLGTQKCEICGIMFGERVTLQLHMVHNHQGQVTVTALTVPSKPPTPPAPVESQPSAVTSPLLLPSLGASLRRKYQRNARRGGIRLRHLAGSASGFGERVKAAIVSHLRGGSRRFPCAECGERFSSRLRCTAHSRAAHSRPLQAFSVHGEEGGHFASLIYLPVSSKVQESVSVTLTPVDSP